MQKTIITIVLLMVSIFIVYKIQDFIEKNKPVEVPETVIVSETPSHITTFEVQDEVVSTSTPSL